MRLVIADLLPGTDYAIQVRSNDGEAVSDWSRVFFVTTISDTVLPEVPNNVTWTVSGDTFHGEWDAVTTNTDAEAITVTGYEVELTGGAVTRIVAVTQQTSGKVTFDLSFEQNKSLFGDAEPEVDMRVRAVGNTNLKSAWSSILTATNAAPNAPTSLVVEEGADAIGLSWTASTSDDVVGYNIYAGTSPSPTTKVASVSATAYTYHSSTYVTHYFVVKAVDKFGQESSGISGSGAPTAAGGVDTTPPSAPATVTVNPGFNAAEQQAYLDVSWATVADSDLSNYVIRFGQTDGDWDYVTVPYTATESRIMVSSGLTYYVAVAAQDFSGNLSGYTNAGTYPVTSSSDTTAPSQPVAPTVTSAVQRIQVAHTGGKQGGGSLESDLNHFQVFASTTSGFTPSTSNMLGTMRWNGVNAIETFDIPASGSAGATTETWYVVVKAVDNSDNIGPSSPQATSTPGLVGSVNITSLNADRIVAGTGLINDLTVKSTLTLGDASTNGIIRSYDYQNTSGKEGFYLDKDEFILKTGAVEAPAIKLEDSVNLMHWQYADFESSEQWPVTTFNATVTYETAIKRFNSKSLKMVTSSTSSYVSLIDSLSYPLNPVYALSTPAATSKTYIVSFYAYVPASSVAHSIAPYLSYERPSDSTIQSVVGSTVVVPDDDVWRRYTYVMTIPNTVGDNYCLTLVSSTNGTIYFDGIQIEEQIGGATVASAWRPPGGTAISGDIIRTGEIRSNNTVVVNGVAQPTWAISLEGNAQFGNASVRGHIIVGSANASTGEDDDEGSSYIQSSNYVPGESGWIIRSDGFAELRELAADSVNGDVIRAGTLSVNTLKPLDTLTNEIIVEGKLYASGEMGEEVGLSGDGFSVRGPYQVNVTNKEAASGVATFTTAIAHGFGVGNKVVIEIGDSNLDGIYTVSTIPDSTHFTVASAATVTSAATTGTAKSLSNNADVSRPTLIEFPTDGTNPNIISGFLFADTLTVSSGASLRGTSEIERSSKIIINSAILAPKAAPAVSLGYRPLTLTGLIGTSTGITRGHNGNLFVASYTSSTNYISEFNSTTGAFIATRVSFTRSPSPATSSQIKGIAYSPVHDRYYTLTTNIGVIGYAPIVSGRDERVSIYESNWSSVPNPLSAGIFTDVNNDAGWGGSTIGWDYVNDRPICALHDSSKVITRTVTLDIDGDITGYGSTVNLTGSSSTTDPKVIVRASGYDNGLGADRIIVKNGAYGTSAWTQQWIPFDTSGTSAQSTEQWDGGVNTYGGFYDEAADRFYGLSSNQLLEFQSEDSMWGHTFTVTNKALTSNVATLTTSAAHDFWVGATIVVAGVDSTFNGTFTVTAITDTTVSYAKTASNVASTASGGTVKNNLIAMTAWRYVGYSWYDSNATGGTHETNLSPRAAVAFKKRSAMTVTISAIPKGAGGTDDPTKARVYVAAGGSTEPNLVGTVATAWHLRETIDHPATTSFITPIANASGSQPNNTTTNGFSTLANDPGQIVSTTGNSFWKGDDTAQFYQLVVTSATDAATSAGNKPALRIGSTTGTHLRIDGNEILAMTSDTAQGTLTLNAAGTTFINNLIGNSITGSMTYVGATHDFPDLTTGTFTANMNWNSSNGRLRVNTSSARYKENIQDATIDTDAVLALTPRTFQRNDDRDADNNILPVTQSSPWYVGFIAEEAADLGLEHWVIRDAEGPWSFAYDYWVVALHAVAREQRDKIADLEARIAALEVSDLI